MSNERHEAIGRAIERAAQVLPDGYTLEIHVKRGSGWVKLRAPDFETYPAAFNAGDSFYDQINDAIDTALAESEGDHD